MSEIPEGRSIEKRILARRIAVFNDRGKLIGIESDCKHMRASLGNGELKDGVLTCRWHHWRYDLESGACLNVKGVKLKKYEVEIDGEDVYLLVG